MKQVLITFGLLLVIPNVYAELCPELEEVNQLLRLLNTEYSSLPTELQVTTSTEDPFEQGRREGKTGGQVIDEMNAKTNAIQNWVLMKQNIQGRIEQEQKNMEAVFNPICGTSQDGTRKTFRNPCKLRQEFATFIEYGECQQVQPKYIAPPQPKTQKPIQAEVIEETPVKKPEPIQIVEEQLVEEEMVEEKTSTDEELEQLKARIKELEAKHGTETNSKDETNTEMTENLEPELEITTEETPKPKKKNFFSRLFGSIANWFK